MTGLTAARPSVSSARAPVVRRLVSLLAQRRGSVVVVGILVLAAAVVELVPPLVVRDIVDRHLTVGRSDGLPALALLYLLGIAAMQAMTFLYGYLAAAVAQGVLSDLRTRLFAHLQRLPASYFDRVPIGDVISRCTADVDTLDTVFSSGVALLLANLVRLVTIAVAMVALSPELSLIATLIAAPLVLVTRALQVRVRQAERESRVAIGAVNTRLQEDLRGIEVIRAFGREPEFIAGFRQVLSRGLAAFNRSSFYSALYTPMTAILSAIAVAALLAAGTQQAFGATSISLGTLTAFLLLLQRFFQPITALGEEWQTVQGAMAGAERIFDTLGVSAPERTRLDRVPSTWSVVLSDVDFGYAEGQPVLHGLSLQAKAGEHVAVVGRTGAGKTSALHLIAGCTSRGRAACSWPATTPHGSPKPSATGCWVWCPRWFCCSRGPCSTT
jgi:ATP-binding cassette subfamily B protein